MKLLSRCVFVAVLAVQVGCGSVPPAAVSPQRAAFSSDPSTTAHSTLEIEAGFFATENQTLDVPLALKWGATETAELFLAWSPYVRLASREGDVDGVGDIVVGSRVRFREETENGPAAAVEVLAKLPTADSGNGIGTGLVDFFTAASVAKHLGHAGMIVGYYQIGVLSQRGATSTLLEHTVSTALSRKLSGPLQGHLEVAGVFNPHEKREALLFGLGLGYEVNASLILDLEGFLGLTNDANPLAISTGLTTNLGSLF